MNQRRNRHPKSGTVGTAGVRYLRKMLEARAPSCRIDATATQQLFPFNSQK